MNAKASGLYRSTEIDHHQTPIIMLTIALILVFTLLCVALSDDRAWDNATRSVRNALVFEGRHREYGAYELRRDYDRRFGLALLTALGITGGLIGLAFAFSGKAIVLPKPTPTTVVEFINPIDPPEPPKPQPTETRSSNPITPQPTPTPQPDPTGFVEAHDSMTTKLVTDTTTIAPVPPGGGGGAGTLPPGGAGGSGDGTLTGPTVENTTTVEELPEFPGGEAAMYRWLKEKIIFPDTDLGSDKVYVEFVVDTDGSIRDVKTVKGKYRDYIAEAERVVKRMPKWKAARMGKKDVPCRLVLPISFEVRN